MARKSGHVNFLTNLKSEDDQVDDKIGGKVEVKGGKLEEGLVDE